MAVGEMTNSMARKYTKFGGMLLVSDDLHTARGENPSESLVTLAGTPSNGSSSLGAIGPRAKSRRVLGMGASDIENGLEFK